MRLFVVPSIPLESLRTPRSLQESKEVLRSLPSSLFESLGVPKTPRESLRPELVDVCETFCGPQHSFGGPKDSWESLGVRKTPRESLKMSERPIGFPRHPLQSQRAVRESLGVKGVSRSQQESLGVNRSPQEALSVPKVIRNFLQTIF